MKRFIVITLLAIAIFGLSACKKKPQITSIELKQFDQAYQVPDDRPTEVLVPTPIAVPMPGQLKPLPGHEKDTLPEDALMRIEYTKDHAKIQPPETPEGWINSIAKYQYIPGALYQVYCSVGRMTDIALQTGETLLDLSAGDTERWKVKQTESGNSESRRDHIHLKPEQKNIETNFTINTDRRVYYIELISTENGAYHSGISWTYPLDDFIVKRPVRDAAGTVIGESGSDSKAKTMVENFGLTDPAKLNFNYGIKGDASWKPVRVFDNAQKTYVQFRPEMRFTDAPTFFIKSGSGDLELTNYRHKGNYYVVDRLFDEAVLTVGNKHQDIVTITRN